MKPMSGESLRVMALRASSNVTCVAGAAASSPAAVASASVPQPSSNAARWSRSKRCGWRWATPRPLMACRGRWNVLMIVILYIITATKQSPSIASP
ncbi:hypothetical protein D9M69_651360 [compost metagenome]